MKKTLLAAAALCAIASPTFAADVTATTLKINDPYAYPTADGVKNGAVFMSIENTGDAPDRLISVTSPYANHVEIHKMVEAPGGVTRMEPMPEIAIAAKSHADLIPGGLHLMLMDLKSPLKTGQEVPLALSFEKAGMIDIKAPVQTLADKEKALDEMGYDRKSGPSASPASAPAAEAPKPEVVTDPAATTGHPESNEHAH